jgi:hypothetical protein
MNFTETKVGWAAEPDGRGTMGLLWSCFATILLCTWSAYHPNLPAAKDTPWIIFKVRCAHMVLGIFAPEVVAWFACEEMIGVKYLKRKAGYDTDLGCHIDTYNI